MVDSTALVLRGFFRQLLSPANLAQSGLVSGQEKLFNYYDEQSEL